MKKRMICLLIVLVMIALVIITGCSQTSSINSSEPAVSSNQSAAQSQTVSSPAASQSQSASSSPASAQAAGNGQSLADIIGAAQKVQSMSLDFTVTTSDGKTVSGSIWGETGKMLKIQTTVNGAETVEIINLTDKTLTMYQTATKTGEKIAEPAGMDSSAPGSYLLGLDATKVQDLGTDTINGETCRVVQYTSPSVATTTVKMWISTSLNYPVQLISTTTDGKTTQIDYTNIKVGALPSDTFSIPADVTIKSLS